jgi:hypothetical protein
MRGLSTLVKVNKPMKWSSMLSIPCAAMPTRRRPKRIGEGVIFWGESQLLKAGSSPIPAKRALRCILESELAPFSRRNVRARIIRP